MKIYQEHKSLFSHNNKNYDLNKIFKIVHNKPIKQFPINKLKWILKYSYLKQNRINKSDINYPIIITKEKNKFFVVDGIHRLSKLAENNIQFVNVKFLTNKELNSTLIRNPLRNSSESRFFIKNPFKSTKFIETELELTRLLSLLTE